MGLGRKKNETAEAPAQSASRTITICAREGCKDEGVVRPLPGWPLICTFHDAEFEAMTGTGPDGPNRAF
jgi:nitrite reductase/ring-hydroxylating ferredoxin subunit